MMHATHYRIHPKVVAYRRVDIVDESVALENRDDLLAIFLIDADSGAEPDSDREAWTDGPAIAAASARKISGSVYLPPNHRYAPPKCRPMQLTRFSRTDDQPDNHDGTTKLLL